MRRRAFITLLGGAGGVAVQQAMTVIGFVSSGISEARQSEIAVYHQQ
jgi:hypothetical protein